MKRIVILISGRGSNMEAIVRRCADEQWPARVVAVLANRADAKGLDFARAHDIATGVVDHKAHASRDAFDAALAACREAKFTPRVSHTPSLIGTVLQYVEAGAGIGIIPESVASEKTESAVELVPLKPTPMETGSRGLPATPSKVEGLAM